MKIEHLALWAQDLEKLKHFYIQYFDATANAIPVIIQYAKISKPRGEQILGVKVTI